MVDEKIEGLNLKEINEFIRKRIIKISLSILIPAFIALLICLFLPKRYKATVIVIASESISGGSITTPFGTFGKTTLTEGFLPSQLVISLLISRTMREDFIKEFDLIRRYGIEDKKNALEIALEILESRTDVSYSEAEGLIYVSFEASDPEFSAKGANFYIENLDKLNERIQLSIKKPLVEVLDPATPPVEDSFPKTIISMIISGLFGLFFYLLFLWLRKELS